MEAQRVFLTKEGFQALGEEYVNLIRRAEKVQMELRQALWHSEEFIEDCVPLMEELNLLDKYILLYASVLVNAIPIVPPPKQKRKGVYVGAIIEVLIDNESHQLQIVGVAEAKPAEGKISNECPLAKTLLGRKEGERFVLHTPVEVNYSIQKVSYL